MRAPVWQELEAYLCLFENTMLTESAEILFEVDKLHRLTVGDSTRIHCLLQCPCKFLLSHESWVRRVVQGESDVDRSIL